MITAPFESLHIVQNAYVVRDLDEAIERWHAALGLGPFVVSRHLQFERTVYRGAPVPLDISVAFAQAGELQIELLCQHNDGPSAFRDAFGPGEEGLHHVALFPEDYERFVEGCRARGFAVAAEIAAPGGGGAAFIDTRGISGHMLEVYRGGDRVRALYRFVARTSRDWDGRSLIIDITP